jgi:hypothetical protein
MQHGKGGFDHRAGGASLNYDPANDSVGQTGIERVDPSPVIGTSIPSGLFIAILNGESAAYIAVGGGIFKADIGNPRAISRIYWRQFF